MPELPEVQTMVNDLNKKILGRKIIGVWYDEKKSFRKPKAELVAQEIKNTKIKTVGRRGKNILIYLSKIQKARTKNYLLLIHPKMTGHLLYGRWSIRKAQPSPLARGIRKRPSEYQIQSLIKGPLQEKVNKYIHLIFYLDNGCQLALSDLRKFAKILFGPEEKILSLPDLARIGPEPLHSKFSFGEFRRILLGQKRKIKQVLMDQSVIAGIGNIYSDDILWTARVHPAKPAFSLTQTEMRATYNALNQILKTALKLRGTSISNFRDASGKSGSYGNRRLVYRLKGEPCKRCHTPIERVKIGGRSAHFCPKCQKLTND